MKKMVIGNIHIDIVRKHIKNMHLAVYPPDGKVRLAVPATVRDETIRLFSISKIGWIRKQQKRFRQQDRESPRMYVNRETHHFFGKRYLLKIVEGGKSPIILKKSKILELHVRPDTGREKRHSIMMAWYRSELKKIVPEILNKWERMLGVKAEFCGVRQMKTKWGTCNSESKRIWLNSELAKKPVHCIEYIIVHELVHLLERNHNDRFVAYMDKFLPHWRNLKNELNRSPVSHKDWAY